MVVDEGKAESVCARKEDGARAVAANVLAMTVGAAPGQKQMQSKPPPRRRLRARMRKNQSLENRQG
jgi:hypothetical protein